MGTWDFGPFDNDTAADFGCGLDEAAREEREAMIRGVLKRAADPADYLDASDGERAVASAALVVGQHPDGEPACSIYGPSEPLPALPTDLRTLAVDALDQVVSDLSELAELWAEAAKSSGCAGVRAVGGGARFRATAHGLSKPSSSSVSRIEVRLRLRLCEGGRLGCRWEPCHQQHTAAISP